MLNIVESDTVFGLSSLARPNPWLYTTESSIVTITIAPGRFSGNIWENIESILQLIAPLLSFWLEEQEHKRLRVSSIVNIYFCIW